MGAGRKTETCTLAPDSLYASGYGTRNLKKGDLCGVIFGCNFSTIKECYAKNLFGLPAPHMAYIKNIDLGLTLFLFNYSDRTLHGIFEAASEGKLNIDPIAWSPNGTNPSPYPAQVKVRVRVRCEPLLEEKFSTAISENYNDEKMFWFELDQGQTNKLLRLFSPSISPSSTVRAPSTSRDAAPPSRKPIPGTSLAQIGDLGATCVDKWSSLFKSSDESNKNKEKDSNGAGSILVNVGKTVKNVVERKAQPSASQHGGSFSSVVRNMTDSSTLEKKTSSTHEVRSQATKGVENYWSSASRVGTLRQESRGPSKEVPGEDTISEIDWDAAPSFKVHMDGLNKILEDPKDKDCFKRFEGNMGQASSSMVPNSWEDEKISWDYDEKNIAKSPCGSSYVSAATREMGSPNFVDILTEILAEVKELKHTQMRQAERMISLEMDLIDSRREILRLKGSNGSY